MSVTAPARAPRDTVETKRSWAIAFAALAIMVVSYGSPLMTSVALPQIAAAFDDQRSVPALANALVWLGSGAGGILMGPLAERFGTRATVVFGGVMIALGFAVSTLGGATMLLVGHGVMIGILGTGAIHAPLYVYVSRWFDRHRGTALALVASGQYLGGAFWPSILLIITIEWGWERSMVIFGGVALLTIIPVAALFLHPAPADPEPTFVPTESGIARPAAHPFAFFPSLCLASVLCCIPMAMPMTHLPALCSDVGIPPPTGAAMLSVLLGLAFVSRQLWGWLSDRIGGLATVLAGSICQAAAMAGFLFVQSEAGLFAVSAAFGLGFSGIVPAYILSVREFFPASEANWRVPILFFCSLIGMALGSWIAGVIYDEVGSYAPAFTLALVSNAANLFLVLFLIGIVLPNRSRRLLG
jgi:MFS family permease